LAEFEANINKNRSHVTYTRRSKWGEVKKNSMLYILLAPAVLITFFFKYLPLPGLVVAFMDFNPLLQFSSPWVGFGNFIKIFTLPMFVNAIGNTFMISVLSLVVLWPAPIIFALLINELNNGVFKKIVQTVSYLPHFLAWISVIGIAMSFYSIYGPLNDFMVSFIGPNFQRAMFLANQNFFIPNVLVLSGWKEIGWASIIYLAAITSIDAQLYEASYMDGAGRWKQFIHVTLPGLAPTIIILLILKMGSLFADNFELIYGLQNPFINFEVVSTMVYKQGILNGKYSVATAFDLVQGIISFILVLTANKISKKVSEISIW